MKKHLLGLSFVFAASIATASQKDFLNGTIVGGVEAKRGEFPFIVSLQDDSLGHFCGGSLVRKNWVLTAAHCVQSGVDKVLIGLHDRSQPESAESLRTKRIIVHPNYSEQGEDFDFALIELDRLSKYPTIAMNSVEFHIPDTNENPFVATTAGWGTLEQGASRLPEKLQKVSLPLVPRYVCEQSYPNQITSRMICAGYAEGGKDSCQGDSGGPLIGKSEKGQSVLVGVVSWGQGCAKPRFFGVYSKVSSVRDWIRSTIR